MNKDYLEAFEKLGHYALYESYDDLQVNETEEFNIVKQALLELKAIKESNPSEALNKLLDRANHDEYLSRIGTEKAVKFLNENQMFVTVIKQAVLKAQEQENVEYKKVLEIVFKKKIVDIKWLKASRDYKEYNAKMLDLYDLDSVLIEEEFELLRKWSKCLLN